LEKRESKLGKKLTRITKDGWGGGTREDELNDELRCFEGRRSRTVARGVKERRAGGVRTDEWNSRGRAERKELRLA